MGESFLVTVLSSLVTVIVAGFAVWKSYYESNKTEFKVAAVRTTLDAQQLELEENRALLVRAQARLGIAETERETLREQLYTAREKIIVLEGQNLNQERRIQELMISITTLTRLIQEGEQEVTRIRNAPATVRFVVDADGVIREVSPNVTDILGYRQDELVGKNHVLLVPWSARERHGPAFTARAQAADLKDDVVTIRQGGANRKQGGTVPMRIELSEYHFDGKKMFAVNMIQLSATGEML